MFSAFRRFTTLIEIFGEYKMRGRLPPRDQQAAGRRRLVMRGRLPPRDQQAAVLVMSLGAAVAGFTDLTFSLPGFTALTFSLPG
ncbi:hypothetical protein T484DRAFT_1795297 [Baffinella frigidus]|nr:hypothetical protein T484DRAFT_1795297 [Cryptophyta sp. CCMP2293]